LNHAAGFHETQASDAGDRRFDLGCGTPRPGFVEIVYSSIIGTSGGEPRLVPFGDLQMFGFEHPF
jgi:hypothetical protein